MRPDFACLFHADMDPDPACHFDADVDPDSTFYFDAVPDPDPSFQIKAQNGKKVLKMMTIPILTDTSKFFSAYLIRSPKQ